MFDVSKMTAEELKTANAKILAELRKREDEEQAKLWKNFVDALCAYCKRFGDIKGAQAPFLAVSYIKLIKNLDEHRLKNIFLDFSDFICYNKTIKRKEVKLK